MSKLNKSKRQAKKLASAQTKIDSNQKLTGAESRALSREMDRQTAETQAQQKVRRDANIKESTDLMAKNKAAGEMIEEKHTFSSDPTLKANIEKYGVSDDELAKGGYKETARMTAEEARDRADKGLGTKFEEGSGIWHKFDKDGHYQNKAVIRKPKSTTSPEKEIKIDANLPNDPGITSTADFGTEVPIKQATDTRQNTDMKNMVNKTKLKESETALNTSTPTQDTSTDTNTSASSGGIDASEYDDYTKRKDWSGTGKSDPNAEIEQHVDDPSLSPYQKQKVKEAGQDVYANNPIGQYSVSASGMANYTPAGSKTSSPKPVTTPKTKVSQEELDKGDRDKLFKNKIDIT